MKRILLSLLMISILSNLCYGMFNIRVGTKGRMNYSILVPGEGLDNWTGIGYGGGGLLDIKFLESFGIELDILYSVFRYEMQGRGVDAYGAECYSITSTQGTLHTSLLIKYRLLISPMVSTYLAIGPSSILQLHGKAETKSTAGTYKIDIYDELIQNEIAMQVALGLDIGLIPKLSLMPDFRFQYNLTADDPSTQECSEKIFDFLLGLGLCYRIL